MNEHNGRLTQLETKLAYMEDFLNSLQQVAVEHSQQLDALRAENRALRNKLSELTDSLNSGGSLSSTSILTDLANSRPPHY